MPELPDPAVHRHQDAAPELVRRLKAERGKDIWLCDGAKLAGGPFTEIDELIPKIARPDCERERHDAILNTR